VVPGCFLWFLVVLVVPCGSWLFLVVSGGFLWFLVVHGGSLWFLVVPCGFWWFLVVPRIVPFSGTRGGGETVKKGNLIHAQLTALHPF